MTSSTPVLSKDNFHLQVRCEEGDSPLLRLLQGINKIDWINSMRLEQIGFYTLSDKRAAMASADSPLSRCELLLTSRCNFQCPYCRRVGGDDMPFDQAVSTVLLWASQGLFAIRFSGGEPLFYPRLIELVELAKSLGIKRIAISSNGSFPLWQYEDLLQAGVNDLSISLDACCAEDADKMSGGVKGLWNRVTCNITALAANTYVTVGVVVTPDNLYKVNDIVKFAASLGVQDIRVIPAAQDGNKLCTIYVDDDILSRFPILQYRINNFRLGRPVRGLCSSDNHQCPLVLDDMAVCGNSHYPCIIYLREGGAAIGKLGAGVRQQREAWYQQHDTHSDPICRVNCLDVCVDYNNKYRNLHGEEGTTRRLITLFPIPPIL